MGKKRKQMFNPKYAGHPRSRLNKKTEAVVAPPVVEVKPATPKEPKVKTAEPKKVAPRADPSPRPSKKTIPKHTSKKSRK